METTNKNAVTLIRVSTKKQGGEDRFGMDAQRRSNERIVADQGFKVCLAIEYKDVSGDAVMYTPEMQELQAFLRTPAMMSGNLVAKELSRLLRPNYNDYPLLQVFVDQKISIYLPTYVLQLWTPEGRMLAGVLCAVDFNEAERIRERCMGGREGSRLLGYCAAGGMTVPSGVLWDVKTKKWSYDNIYAPKIAEAFRMFAGGETNFRTVINKLNLCLRSPRGAAVPATPTGLRRILENRMFLGEREYSKKMDLSIPKHKLMYLGRDNQPHERNRPYIPREPSEVIVRQVINPGLVSREIFDKVQFILRAKSDKFHQSHSVRSERPQFIYQGLLFCGDCGQPLYTVCTAARDGGYYRCRDHFPKRGGKRQCESASMNRKKLEAALDQLFSIQFPRTHFLAEILKAHHGSENRKEIAQRRERINAQQSALAQKRERIIEFALDGAITKADRDRRLGIVDTEIEVNRRTLTELTETPVPDYWEWCDLMRPFKNFPGLSTDEKRKLITTRFQEIRVKDYRVVSLYLLTGEVVTPDPIRENQVEVDDGTKCYSCRHDLCHEWEKVESHGNFCDECSQGLALEREYMKAKWRGVPHPLFPEPGNDSCQRL